MKIKPLVIFDMDGVLIDVSESYREVVRFSVIYYLRYVLGAGELKDDFITIFDVATVKKSGGLNNDWDLTYTILNVILKHYFDEQNSAFKEDFIKIASMGEERSMLKAAGRCVGKFNHSILYREVKSFSCLDINFHNSRIRVSPFLLNKGDVKSGNIVKRIFQELYLGKKLFTEIYEEPPLFYHEQGYIEKETLIPTMEELKELSDLCILAIATGRPGMEAHYALNHFGIKSLFREVVTEDDIIEAEKQKGICLRKPHPYTLILCMKRCGEIPPFRVWYIGDMPDDILASRKAGFYPFGFVNKKAINDPEEALEHRILLLEKGAHRVFGDFRTLIGFFRRFPE